MEEALEALRRRRDETQYFRVFYTMRRCGVPHLRASMVEAMRVAVAIDDVKLPITAELAAAVLGVSTNSTRERMHRLGDMGLVELEPEKLGRMISWKLSPKFASEYSASGGAAGRPAPREPVDCSACAFWNFGSGKCVQAKCDFVPASRLIPAEPADEPLRSCSTPGRRNQIETVEETENGY